MAVMEGVSFDTFRYDPARQVLSRDGVPVPLGTRAAALLHLLLARRGDVVGKDELVEAAWPGLAVEESNLSVQIAALRRALGRAPGGREWIATVQRVGYRFLPDPAPRRDELPPLGPPHVAVLPFLDFAGQPGTMLGDYLAQDVITALARFRSLTVAARGLSFAARGGAVDVRDVARELGAAYVVEGSFRRIDDRLRLSLQLVAGTTGATLWADNLHLPLTNGVGDTDDLAGRAAAAIEAQVQLAEIGRTVRARTESVEAYDLYLRAELHVRSSLQADNAVALGLYLKALELEPRNVTFLAGAAVAIHHRVAVGWPALPGLDAAAARHFARIGLDYIEGDGTSLGLFGNAMFTAREEELGGLLSARAVQINDNSTLALVCDALSLVWNGDVDAAEQRFLRAARLSVGEPNHRFALTGLATVARLRGDWAATLQRAQRAHAFSPGISGAHQQRIAASVMLGRMDDARRYLAHYMRIAPGVTIRSIDSGQPYRDRSHIRPLLDALRRAGLPER